MRKKPLKMKGDDGNVEVQGLQQSFSKVDTSKNNYTPRVTHHKHNMSNIKMNISRSCTILGNNITRCHSKFAYKTYIGSP
jgi:hypothetical protein